MKTIDYSFFRSVAIAATLVTILWLIKGVEWMLGADFGSYGILPQHWEGLKGILFAPFLHGSWQHLLNNSGPVFVLLLVLLTGYPKIALQVFLFIQIVGGLLVWATAHELAYHIGMSGVIYGLAAFLIAAGIFRKDKASTSIALLVGLMYGGMLTGFVPQEGISWQSHFWGAVAGVVIAVLYRNRDLPAPMEEEQDEDDADKGHFFEQQQEQKDGHETIIRSIYPSAQEPER